MKYILNKKLAHLGTDRLCFSIPCEGSISSDSTYEGTWIVDLLVYDDENAYYAFEDTNVMLYTPTAVLKEHPSVVFLTIKPIIYKKTDLFTIYIDTPLSVLAEPTTAFLGFHLLKHSEMKALSGFLITPSHYQYLLAKYQSDASTKDYFLPNTEAYSLLNADFIVSEITETSVASIFDFFINHYMVKDTWERDLKRRFFIWSVPPVSYLFEST